MKFGYARVSTVDQNLDLQTDALQAAGCEKIVTEKISGSGKKSRPEFDHLFDQLREGDTLVVFKLDRLGRSTRDLIRLTEEMSRQGIEFISLQDNIDTSNAMGKALFRILMVLAEMERDILVERTQAGLQAARRRGRKGGRPRVDHQQITRALKLYTCEQYSVSEIEEMTGIKPATLYRYLKEAKK